MYKVLSSMIGGAVREPMLPSSPKSVLENSFLSFLIKKYRRWYEGSVAYQIYPRSFYDANGDGVGDLQGIIKKLDYLAGTKESIGVEAIWLSPFYRSPNVDFGYDISDYCSVDPLFGTLADFNELIQESSRRNLKIIVDLVPNHTSDQHSWFKESRSSLDNARRDWYIWRDAKPDGGPPNNWRGAFGGSAWELDKLTGQYYLHSFTAQQPDLNWENPAVRLAIVDVMRFWLNLGVSGFRVDAVSWISKDKDFSDDPLDHSYRGASDNYNALSHVNSRNGPNLYKYLRQLSKVIEEYEDAFMVLESHPESIHHPTEDYLKLYESINSTQSAPFNFEGISLPWQAELFKKYIDGFQSQLKPQYLPIYTLGNHDKSRLASRVGAEAARTAAMMLLTLPGMPFIYYGEEIGMQNVMIPSDAQKDPARKEELDREIARTPLQWNSHLNAGFSTGHSWLPVADDYRTNNIEAQLADSDSILNLYRALIRLRADSEALKYGDYRALELKEHGAYGFTRSFNGKKAIILLNFSGRAISLDLPWIGGEVVLSTHTTKRYHVDGQPLKLLPHEGLIIDTRDFGKKIGRRPL